MKSLFFRSAIILPWVSLIFILSSCGWVRKDQDQSYINRAIQQAQTNLNGGDFRGAIDAYKEIYQKYSNDPVLQGEYIRTLESIKKSADRAFGKGDFPQAGRAYEILLRNYSSQKEFHPFLSYNREILGRKLEACKKVLFERALRQYRYGNLNQAISVWKSILTFDPENQEIKRIVDIATVQIENLERF
jgi:outer membrane protein assembly factor BamD (BamD/ComL family)